MTLRGSLSLVVALTLALASALPVAAVHAQSSKSAKSKKSATSSKTAKKSTAPDSNEVLIRFGKQTITRGDVQRRIDSLPEQFRSNYATPEGRQQLLDRMVEERVWLAEAQKHGVDSRTTVKQQIEQQRRDLLIRTYLNELMSKNPTVSDSEARVYYDQHPGDFKVPATITV